MNEKEDNLERRLTANVLASGVVGAMLALSTYSAIEENYIPSVLCVPAIYLASEIYDSIKKIAKEYKRE